MNHTDKKKEKDGKEGEKERNTHTDGLTDLLTGPTTGKDVGLTVQKSVVDAIIFSKRKRCLPTSLCSGLIPRYKKCCDNILMQCGN